MLRSAGCCRRFLHDGPSIKIGNVSSKLRTPKNPELVPRGYTNNLSQDSLRHIRWLLQKDLLGQDAFLIGPPGPRKRWLALAFAELTNREIEYLSLSRDITETDIKQRREIVDGSAIYTDASAVRAAINGRTLILDGVERVERNVLPVLNNLLENREAQLEDGRFLMESARWDQFAKTSSPSEMESFGLVRVDEYFRVIALGLPIPLFRGAPLDPPLRSRFQARQIEHSKYYDVRGECIEGGLNEKTADELLSVGYAINTTEARDLGVGVYPTDVTPKLALLPTNSHALFCRLFPYTSGTLGETGEVQVEGIIRRLGMPKSEEKFILSKFEKEHDMAKALFTRGSYLSRENLNITYNINESQNPAVSKNEHFYENGGRGNHLASILMSLSAGDVAIIGDRGVGKQTLGKEISRLLDQKTEPILLYQDMSSRDLLQQRNTDKDGNTVWRYAPLVSAAIEGRIALLDGIDRLYPGTLSLIQRLTQDRELTLHDGTRLLGEERFAETAQHAGGLSDEEMKDKGILKISPAFRIIAFAERPTTQNKWLTPEIIPSFIWHELHPLPTHNESDLLQHLVGLDKATADGITKLANDLRNSNDAALKSVSKSYSTKQLIRIGKRIKRFPTLDLQSELERAALNRFLPLTTKEALESHLKHFSTKKSTGTKKTDIITTAGELRIGSVTHPIKPASEPKKVPAPLFYHNDAQDAVLESLLSDWVLGEHLLLVGNQGVGKNKLADRLLELLQLEREYIQLHRDTTIQQLTSAPALVDGKLEYEDSPLIKACVAGHVLIIDEADKAPTHVTSTLRSLLESRHIRLPDGRVISEDPTADIQLHPNFRIIALANRPGFPFLGNDFFGACGDSFSSFAIDNPTLNSEKQMLKRYAPGIDEAILDRLVATFAELRAMADQGQTQYPYSTREAVAIVKHLAMYPDEGIQAACQNVFDFDVYNEEASKLVVNVLQRHGIPVNAKNDDVRMAAEWNLGDQKPTTKSYWSVRSKRHSIPLISITQPVSCEELNPELQYWKKPHTVYERSSYFSEQRQSYQLPEFGSAQKPNSVAIAQNEQLAIGVQSPISIYTSTRENEIIYLDLWDAINSGRHGFQARMNVVPLITEQIQYEDEHGKTRFEDGRQLFLAQERVTNQMFLVTPDGDRESKTGFVYRLTPGSGATIFGQYGYRRGVTMPGGFDDARPKRSSSPFKLVSDYSETTGTVYFYSGNNTKIHRLKFDPTNILRPEMSEIELGVKPIHVQAVSPTELFIEDIDGNYYKTHGSGDDALLSLIKGAEPINISPFPPTSDCTEILMTGQTDKNFTSRCFTSTDSTSGLLVGAPSSELYEQVQYDRPVEISGGSLTPPVWLSGSVCAQLVTPNRVPSSIFTTDKPRPLGAGSFIELTDFTEMKIFYIPVPETVENNRWLRRTNDYCLGGGLGGLIVTCDGSGLIREYDSFRNSLNTGLKQWIQMVGDKADAIGALRVEYDRVSGLDTKTPKHGKEDPNNDPHVGGNTWAGGTGGRDTAGLGGKGGPYRLDKGHDVHQLSDAEKADVPDHVRKAAKAQAEQALRDRLNEIKMSAHDHDNYQNIRGNISQEISTIKALIEGLEAKSKEREWLKNQTDGELDDNKLVEGLVGEKLIYRRRREPENDDSGFEMKKPKRLTILADCSASMYRFNGTDGRLNRQLEALLMVMEGLDSIIAKEKIRWDIVGHSGDSRYIPLTTADNPPSNDKERFKVLQETASYPQFCFPGDFTIEATRDCVKGLAAEAEADERFLIVLTDANLDRYGIPIRSLANALDLDATVNTCCISIGSLGDQALRMKEGLPAGRSYVVQDTSDIPKILRTFFQSTLLKG